MPYVASCSSLLPPISKHLGVFSKQASFSQKMATKKRPDNLQPQMIAYQSQLAGIPFGLAPIALRPCLWTGLPMERNSDASFSAISRECETRVSPYLSQLFVLFTIYLLNGKVNPLGSASVRFAMRKTARRGPPQRATPSVFRQLSWSCSASSASSRIASWTSFIFALSTVPVLRHHQENRHSATVIRIVITASSGVRVTR